MNYSHNDSEKWGDTLESIRIQKLRSLVDTGEIELAPLTVLVGQNSVGKSTFLRMFPLFQQSMKMSRSEPLLWYSPELVDFGNFNESINKKTTEDSIDFNFKFKISMIEFEKELRFRNRGIDKNLLERLFSEESQQVEIAIMLKVKSKFISNVKFTVFDYEYNIELTKEGKLVQLFINGESFPTNNLYSSNYASREIIPTISVEKKARTSFTRYSTKIEIQDEANREMIKTLAKIRNARISDKRLLDLIGMLKVDYKDEFKTQFNREFTEIATIKKLMNNLDPDEIKELIERMYILNGYKYINVILDVVNNYLFDFFENIQYIAPIRASAQRYYRIQGLSIDDITPQGENIPMLLWNMKQANLAHYNEWREWTKSNFNVEFIIHESEANLSMKLIKNGEEINLADTGFGFSQILPILLYVWRIKNSKKRKISESVYFGKVSSNSKTLVIEQPELHLHPAMQAKLMDMFMEIISVLNKGNFKLKIIMETHSETMINRIGHNIALNTSSLDPNQVNIYIFSEDKNKNISIEKSNFTKDGYLENWPIGFFIPEIEGED